VLYQRGRFAEASAAYARLVELTPSATQEHADLAAARAMAGDAQGASEAQRRAVALAPDDRQAHDYLCELLRYLGDEDGLRLELERWAGKAGR
jgi:tetratricopeptide (TPR) repeat protein